MPSVFIENDRMTYIQADDSALAPETRASAWNRSRNPNTVRMALTLSKDPAAGGVGKLEIVIVGLGRL